MVFAESGTLDVGGFGAAAVFWWNSMIFVTGALYAGKREYIRSALGLSEKEFAACAIWDVQELALTMEWEKLLKKLGEKEIVIATEIGGGLIPVKAEQRAKREAAGRLACQLAGEADTVIRVCCGLPQLLKGNWP